MIINYPFFFFNATATTEIYTLSLHDALPILSEQLRVRVAFRLQRESCRQRYVREERAHGRLRLLSGRERDAFARSEEHTSELQSQSNLVCRLLLEKKNKRTTRRSYRC